MLVEFCKKVPEVAEDVRKSISGLWENKDNEMIGHVARA